VGDALSALGELYDTHALRIFRYIYHRLGDQSLAEDLTSEVFVRFLHAHAEPVNAAAFLYRIAHNLIVDYVRQRQPLRLPEDSSGGGGDDPAYLVELEMERVLLRRAIVRLTPEQQQVIVLKFLEGLTNEEVARIVDKPVGAVKALQHRGLAALRELLARSMRDRPMEPRSRTE
jgi:RNA polymerase sigma-70 factor, ECF subfamily